MAPEGQKMADDTFCIDIIAPQSMSSQTPHPVEFIDNQKSDWPPATGIANRLSTEEKRLRSAHWHCQSLFSNFLTSPLKDEASA